MKKILIIEDEKTLLTAISTKLKLSGYDIYEADNGEDGFQKIKEIKPDLVLLDIILPKKDGFWVMESAKKDPEVSGIPIVIISNSGQPVEIERAKKLGVDDYLIKTDFTPEEVLEKVKKHIGV